MNFVFCLTYQKTRVSDSKTVRCSKLLIAGSEQNMPGKLWVCGKQGGYNHPNREDLNLTSM